MSKPGPKPGPKRRRPVPVLPVPDGGSVTRQEIQDVMADEGYSGDRRKGWLKQVLTALTQEHRRSPSPERKQLIETVKDIMDRHQEGDPIAKDGL